MILDLVSTYSKSYNTIVYMQPKNTSCIIYNIQYFEPLNSQYILFLSFPDIPRTWEWSIKNICICLSCLSTAPYVKQVSQFSRVNTLILVQLFDNLVGKKCIIPLIHMAMAYQGRIDAAIII